MLKYGANIEAYAPNGWTPIFFAAANAQAQVLALLLDNKPFLAQRDKSGQSVVTIAAIRNHAIIVQQLLKAGAERDAVDNAGWTPVVAAANAGSLACVKVLIQNKCSLVGSIGKFAIMKAKEYGYREIAEVLIKAGACE